MPTADVPEHEWFGEVRRRGNVHVAERVRSVLGTGQDESGSRDEALLSPLAELEQLLLFAADDVLSHAHVHPSAKSVVCHMSS